MSDGMREIGKFLGKNRTDAILATKRYHKPKKIERLTDVFDDVISFEMEFVTKHNDSAVSLDLIFKGPPPSSCCGGCYCAVCESFSNVTQLDLTYGYLEGTVNITVDGEPTTNFIEVDPAGGIVILGTIGTAIRICYVYRLGECI